MVEAIIEYLDSRNELTENSLVFVVTEAGKRGIQHLHGYQDSEQFSSSRSIQRIVQDYADKAFGKSHKITPHSLKHTAANRKILTAFN